jgi:hypothetical protein
LGGGAFHSQRAEGNESEEEENFDPEHGDSMFLLNVGIYVLVNTIKNQKNIIIFSNVRTSDLTLVLWFRGTQASEAICAIEA